MFEYFPAICTVWMFSRAWNACMFFPRFVEQCQREKVCQHFKRGKTFNGAKCGKTFDGAKRGKTFNGAKRGKTRNQQQARKNGEKKISTFFKSMKAYEPVPNMGNILTRWCQGPRTFQPVEMAGKQSIGVTQCQARENVQTLCQVHDFG